MANTPLMTIMVFFGSTTAWPLCQGSLIVKLVRYIIILFIPTAEYYYVYNLTTQWSVYYLTPKEFRRKVRLAEYLK